MIVRVREGRGVEGERCCTKGREQVVCIYDYDMLNNTITLEHVHTLIHIHTLSEFLTLI